MKNNKINVILLAGAVLAATACQETIPFEDVIYFSGTEDSPVVTMYVDNGPASRGIAVTSSCKMTEDVIVDLEINADAVASYNAAHGTSYRMLPDGSYDLSASSLKIERGSNVSVPVSFEITSLDDFDDGAQYCVPVSITGTSNGMKVLEASRTVYIMIDQIITTKGVNLGGNWYISFPSMKNHPDYTDLDACTMEIRVLVNKWPDRDHSISTVFGVEENFLLRFGDVKVDNDQLQMSGRGLSAATNSHFSTGRWYHIAVVDDGVTETIYVNGEADGSASTAGSAAINLADSRGLFIGSSLGSRLLNGCVSEARIWNRALSPIELKNNQCYVSPDAEGLLGYWRLDELNENGNFTDLTGRGHDGVPTNKSGRPDSVTEWTGEIKCPVID